MLLSSFVIRSIPTAM